MLDPLRQAKSEAYRACIRRLQPFLACSDRETQQGKKRENKKRMTKMCLAIKEARRTKTPRSDYVCPPTPGRDHSSRDPSNQRAANANREQGGVP